MGQVRLSGLPHSRVFLCLNRLNPIALWTSGHSKNAKLPQNMGDFSLYLTVCPQFS